MKKFKLSIEMKMVIDDEISSRLKSKIGVSYDDFMVDVVDKFEKIFPKNYTYKELQKAIDDYIFGK